ncbi:MAG: cobalamin-binding protein [gamma proteobacterium symbiont of Lucinoma myriamae]|nr:cobalamin-binding protein [gamma proteobacterium symbiont of Lucinoma myriamae]
MKADLNKYIVNLHTLMLFLILASSSPLQAQIQVQDDSGQQIILQQPARRIISLSPGLTELIYAAGGANNIIATVSYSDFPEQAKNLTQIGSYNALDMEKILLLQPDLIVAWKSGNPKHQLEKLTRLGLTVYISEPEEFMDIPHSINSLGKLMASEVVAKQSADDFIKQLQQLKQKYQSNKTKPKKRTFIQIWNNPLMSVNKNHLISKVISFCGGNNIFSQARSLTSSPSVEAVLAQDPEIIIATGMADTSQVWLNRWRQWPFLSAVKNKRLYSTDPNHLVRPTPRILQGIKDVCALISAGDKSARGGL